MDKIEKQSFYDIYLLDIEMPDINGIELAKMIRKKQKNAYIVFITAHAEYAFDTYKQEVCAYQYILKEDLDKRLPVVLNQIWEVFLKHENVSYIIQNKNCYVNMKQSDIQYIYKEDKNVVFITADGRYRERKTIREIWTRLHNRGFIRIDAGRLVNISFIKQIQGNSLTLMDGTELFLSPSNIRKVKNEINNYMGRGE